MLRTVRFPVAPAALGAALCAGLLSLPSGANSASDEAFQRCRVLHGQIDRYTRLRRAGGSSVQMERWRQTRQKYEAEYRAKRCYRFGRRLRPDR